MSANHSIKSEEFSHLSWCALISLSIAKLDGLPAKESAIHDYLVSWLKTSKRNKIFSEALDSNIDWLLNLAVSYGEKCHLLRKLEFIVYSANGKMHPLSDLIRLTGAINCAMKMRWDYRLVTEPAWNMLLNNKVKSARNYIFINRQSLDLAFNELGEQVNPIVVKVSGKIPEINQLLKNAQWCLKRIEGSYISHLYSRFIIFQSDNAVHER